MSKGTRFLIISVVAAAALLFVLGIASATPGGTGIITPSQSKTGLPGTMVTYTLAITNSGGSATFTDTITISYTGNLWQVDGPTQIQLEGLKGTTFNVVVSIPATPTATSDTVNVTGYVAGSAWVPSAQLTTRFYRVYLPIIRRS